MTTFANDAKGNPLVRSAGANAAGFPQYTVWENTFDAADLTTADGDVLDPFIVIPANTIVQDVVVEVITPEASVTIDVGDTTDPNGLVAAASAATAGVVRGAGAYLASNASKHFAAETELQCTIAGAAGTVVKFRVAVAGVNLG